MTCFFLGWVAERFPALVRAAAADALVRGYCALLYRRYPTYVEVANKSGLDRRTVRKHLEQAAHDPGYPA